MKIYKLTFLILWIFFTKNVFANEINSLTESQVDLTNNGEGEGDPNLTIKEGVTLKKDNQQNLIKGFSTDGIENATIILEKNATAQGLHNTIMIRQSDNVTITNSGSIISLGSKAINMRSAQNTTITNKAGATMTAVNNVIAGEEKDADSENVEGTTITNSGTMYSDDQRVIYLYSGADTATVTNNSSGVMYNTNTNEVIHVGSDSTITNSGTIQNRNSPDNDSIVLQGNDNTITLKDKSILVGTINAGTTTGNTLKFQHGVGQGYYYKTSGDFNLQDLDGNQVVKGPAGSVGQGGTETLDELLSYKSLNVRQFLNRYVNSEKLYDGKGLVETYTSFLNREGHDTNLALKYDLFNLGANSISPLENLDFILAYEFGVQDFEADHKIKFQNVSAGLYFPNNKYILNSDSFILGGITLKESERTILTNTTSSGKLDIDSNYQTFEVHSGITKTNSNLIPNVGLTGSFSITPSYEESKYYSWRNRKVGNVSIFFSDKYNLIDNNFNLGWLLDFRSLIGDKSQDYSINGTSAIYKQDNALTREISLVANLDYEKKISDKGKFTAIISAKNTSQNVISLSANFGFRLNF